MNGFPTRYYMTLPPNPEIREVSVLISNATDSILAYQGKMITTPNSDLFENKEQAIQELIKIIRSSITYNIQEMEKLVAKNRELHRELERAKG